MRILVLCTGNSCRSQMAHGFLQSFDKDIKVFSAGTKPVKRINSMAVKVMKEVEIDIGSHVPTNVSEYLPEQWDYVITVCGGAKETCPVFTGRVEHRLHIGFDDPSEIKGNEDYILSEFRRVRDEIKKVFFQLYSSVLRKDIKRRK